MYNLFKYPRTILFFITAFCTGFLLIEKSFSKEIDSTINKNFQEIEVISNRIFSNSAFKYYSNENISQSQIKEINPVQINEILLNIPGISIKNYGGLSGLKTVSLRGTSSNQSLIMLNGIKLNLSQNGSVDLSKIPVNLINSIEIMRGGNSAIYGANSIGGIINLKTKVPEHRFSAGIDYGSFNYKAGNLNYNFRKIPISLFMEYKKNDGDFSFTSNDISIEKDLIRKNSDFENYSVSSFFDLIDTNYVLKSAIIGIVTKKGIPGAVLKNNINSENARYDEFELIFSNSFTKNINNNIFEISANHIISYSDYYSAENKNFILLGSGIFTLNQSLLNSSYNFKLNDLELKISGELSNSILAGNMLESDIEKRFISALSLTAEKTNDYTFGDLNYLSGLRFDYIDDAGTAISPLTGIYYSNKNIKSNFNYSYNFRPPSFNEMYYLNYGNRNLKPEKSHSLNFGLSFQFSDELILTTDLFYIETTDKIVTIPKSPVSWTAENIGEVVNKGIEFKMDWKPIKYYSAKFAYSLQSAIDKSLKSITYNKLIPYIPQEVISMNHNIEFWDYKLTLIFNYSSFTYSLPGNNFESIINEYYSIDINFYKDFKISKNQITGYLKINNITNNNYEIIKNYPMPGIHFYSGIKYRFQGEE